MQANMKSEQISLVDEITRLEERVLQLTRDLENETNRTAEVSQICENYKRDLQVYAYVYIAEGNVLQEISF